jgi:hypothetical protein
MPAALTTGTTGQAAQAEGSSAKAAPQGAQQQVVPWLMAALEASEVEFAIGPIQLSATTPTPLQLQLLLADAWLEAIEMIVTITTAGNAVADVAFAADAPFSILQSVQLQDPGGAQIVAPHSGFQLAMKQKYGAYRIDPPACDPRVDPMFVVDDADTAIGGSARFRLLFPIDCRPFDSYGALPNADSSRQYRLSITCAPTTELYTTAPTDQPTITIVATGLYRLNPPSTLAGRPVQQNPPWYTPKGSARVYHDVITPPIPSSVSGTVGLQLNIQGRIIREIILIARNSAGARIGVPGDGIFPAQTTWVFNKFPRFILSDLEWASEMAEAYSYTTAESTPASGTWTLDEVGTLDTGVRVLHQLMLSGSGKVKANQTGFGWLQTVSGTAILLQGTWGTTVESLEVLVCNIAPGPVPTSLFLPTAIS